MWVWVWREEGVCGGEERVTPCTLDAVYTASRAQGPRALTVDKFTIIPPFLYSVCGRGGYGVCEGEGVCVEGRGVGHVALSHLSNIRGRSM